MHASRAASLFFASAVFLAANAVAQNYPTKPVRVIDGFAPGGSTDIVARAIAPKFQESQHQPLVVDNRPGAQGIIGADIVAKAPPDGYTLLMFTATHTLHPAIYKNMPYEFPKAFAPVMQTSNITNVVAVHPSVPARNVKELIALAKVKPLNFGAGGTGPQMTGELFNSMAGTKMTYVGYKGGSLAALAAVTGEVDLTFATMPTAVGYIRAGRLRPLAVCNATRSVVLPEVPTVAESGLKGYEATNSVGVLAPAATPRDVVRKLNAEIVRILNLQDVRERLFTMGAEPIANTPEEFTAWLRADIAKWAKVVKESGMQLVPW